MAARGNTRQWHSTSTKLRRMDLDAIKDDCDADEIQLSSKRSAGKDVRVKSRKDLRRERRLHSKAKQHESWMRKRGIEIKPPEENENKKKKKKRKKKKKSIEMGDEEISEDAEAELDSKNLIAANEQEDKVIARLEKKLGLKKKRNLTSKFKEDGFDYLLEICEPIDNPAMFMSDDEIDVDSPNGKEPHSDDEPEQSASKPNKKEKKKSKKESMITLQQEDSKTDHERKKSYLDDEDEKYVKDDLFDEDLNGDECDDSINALSSQEGNDAERDLEEDDDIENDVDMEREEEDEDIYSDEEDQDLNISSDVQSESKEEDKRRNEVKHPKKACNVEQATKYVPPQLRKLGNKSKSTDEQQLERLRKQLKGLMNRLSESNMRSIALEVEQMYSSHSRNETNRVLSKLVFEACIMPNHMPVTMLMEHMMLVAILHTIVGNEVGAFFIQSLVEKFNELHSEADKYANGKECDNVLLMIAQLFNFSVIDSLLVYDLIRELVNSFTERDIEMLMLLLKSVGPGIRRADPGSLKEIILQIQAKAASCADLLKQSRVRFMLEVITALRNNNMRKIPQYDPSVIERARKQLKAILKNRDSTSDIQLRISLKDLLQAKDKGRWWVVGSAWTGRDEEANDGFNNIPTGEVKDNKLISLAKKQRMSTDVRKNVFCVIMSSEDYLDCFEKLLKLSLKDKQAREIVHVLIDCCLQEKIYNPYYAFLAQKLCEFSRSNQVTFQYSFWDRFKLISTSSPQNVENLAKLLAHLFASGALSISILKVVGFATIDKPSVRFFMRLFTILLTEYPESTMKNVFARIAPLQKLSLLREGLKIFLKHFLLSKSPSKTDDKRPGRLKELVEIAEASLDGREAVKF